MSDTPPTERDEPEALRRAESLVLVNTGDGKGKSSAAFGVMVRSLARGWPVAVVQFLKSGNWNVGEEKVARDLGVDWFAIGEGFTWDSDDLSQDEAVAREAWRLAADILAAGEHRLVILDEITYPMNWGWIDGAVVIDAIRTRSSKTNVVCTGRDAPDVLVDVADTATEMRVIKHAYDSGVRAMKGIDYDRVGAPVVIDLPFRPVGPEVVAGLSGEDERAALVWSFPEPVAAISSAPVGGGIAALDWLLNIGVTADYARTDLETNVREIADTLGLSGTGAGLLTAVDVTKVATGQNEGVRVDATVGVTRPTWAAAADDAWSVRDGDAWVPGTVNIVVQLPVALTPAAAVNAVITATEAKCQALFEADIPGTGTASDAVVVCWPPVLPAERFAGPRSEWGARLGRAVHGAIAAGLEAHP